MNVSAWSAATSAAVEANSAPAAIRSAVWDRSSRRMATRAASRRGRPACSHPAESPMRAAKCRSREL